MIPSVLLFSLPKNHSSHKLIFLYLSELLMKKFSTTLDPFTGTNYPLCSRDTDLTNKEDCFTERGDLTHPPIDWSNERTWTKRYK